MKQAVAVTRWLKDPYWSLPLALTVAKYVYPAAIVFVWVVTHYLFPQMPFGWLLLSGPIGPVAFLAAWLVLRFAAWVVGRIDVTRQAGVPISARRMVKDLLAERARFADVDARWALFTRAQNISWDRQSPKLHRKQQTADGSVKARVNPAAIGGNLDKIRALASDGTLAGIMDCQEVTVHETSKKGQAWVTFHKNAPCSRPVGLAELPVSGPKLVSFGIDETGGAAAIAYGLSALVVGETGSGKSKWAWNYFADILRDGKPTQLFVIDPKRTELSVFKDLVGKRIGNVEIMAYKRTADEAVTLFADFVAEMKNRQDRLQDRQLAEATEDMPARYVWVDEMNELQKAYAKIDAPMVTAISQGRSSLDWIIASVQVAKVSNLGEVRDQFPINACMRTKTKQNTIAALATDADMTPPCHLIPRDTPGVGYYVTESGDVRKFRSMHVTDGQLDDLGRGILPDGMVRAAPVKHDGPPCFVYIGPDRVLNRCGYVGIAEGFPEDEPVKRRRAQHRRYDRRWCHVHGRVENWWRVHIADTNLQVQRYESRQAALIAEEKLIRQLRPFWNIQHNGHNPDSNESLARRAGLRRRSVDAAREYAEWSREVLALHAVKAGYRKEQRVAAAAARRERFVETVTQ